MEELDYRWPLESIDIVYVKQDGGEWALKDFNGEELLKSCSSLACYKKAAEMRMPIARLQ